MVDKMTKNNKTEFRKDKKTCFIITPIGDDFSDIRRYADDIVDECIISVLEPEYNVVVAHRISETGSITKQIINNIYNADIVIANLTELNPNVMYEVAFRHATKKPIIIIAEKGTKLPFDVATERIIFYENDIHGAIELKTAIKNFLDKISGTEVNNPIYDALKSVKITESILKNFNNERDVNALEYIVERLDKIERMAQLNIGTEIPNKHSLDSLYVPVKVFAPESFENIKGKLSKIECIGNVTKNEDCIEIDFWLLYRRDLDSFKEFINWLRECEYPFSRS